MKKKQNSQHPKYYRKCKVIIFRLFGSVFQIKIFKERPPHTYIITDKEKNSKYNKVNNWIKKDKTQFLLVIANLGLFIVAVIFGWIQSCNTQKGLDFTNRSLKIARVSDSTDNIMRIKDTLAKDRIAKMEFRAYFIVDSFIYYKFKSNIIFGKIGIKMINVGKTPTYKISYRNDYRIGQEITQKDFDSLDMAKFNRSSKCVGANQTLIIDVNLFGNIFTQGKYDSIYKGIINVNFFGKIIYYDIFGVCHYTRYNVRFNPTGGKFYINENFNDSN